MSVEFDRMLYQEMTREDTVDIVTENNDELDSIITSGPLFTFTPEDE